MSIRGFFIWIFLAAAVNAMAQQPMPDTVMKGATIEVIQSYKPQVKQAPKPEWIPQLPPADTAHPAFTYDVPQQTLYYTYSSLPLRPLALGTNIAKLPFANYIAAGAGNLSTLFLDAGIGGIYGPDYETDIHLHHISQEGSIKYQQTMLSGIEAEGTFHAKDNDWHAFINGERDQYNYYGYDHDLYSYSSNDVRQTYTTIRAGADVRNTDSIDMIGYHPAINASLYNALFNTHETNIGFNAPFVYKIDNTVAAQLAITGAITQLSVNSASVNNSFAELLPGISFTGSFSGHGLFGLTIGKGGSFYLLPDLLAAYAIPGSKVMISGGWQATLCQNTYEQLTTENPYISNAYAVTQGRRDEVFANIGAGVGDHLSLYARASWWNYQNLPTYLDTAGDQKQFYVVYDNVNAFSLQLAARYKVSNTFSFGVTGDFYHFYNGSELYVWGAPDTKIKGDLIFTPFSKLTVTAYLAFMSGINAKNTGNNVVKLDAMLDMGGNVEYQIVPRLSAFVQLNNILNDKYQRWQGYQAYGINVYGGLRLKF